MVRQSLHRPKIGGQTRVINHEGIRSRERCGEVSGSLMSVNIDVMSKRLETCKVISSDSRNSISTRGRKVCVLVCHDEAATGEWSRRKWEGRRDDWADLAIVTVQIANHFKIWLKNVFFPNVESKSSLLIDSWTGHCPDAVKSVKPSDKEVEVMIIPKGTTGNIQPLDVFGFRVWKNFVKHFSDSVILHGDNLNLHLRNNIIKLQSLTHNQLSSPR
ncbi:hypothetical protein PV328_001182 [Microctonus aethiopoides]|uniref:DDE-1 domain-containing protein n=1 Tax=Microctonus aethiopoides TaxID=144406 RepID=A0AA39FWS4_9HYME|nr:hypothetical protein PV328_001182 [Microctonus aethiopoides]